MKKKQKEASQNSASLLDPQLQNSAWRADPLIFEVLKLNKEYCVVRPQIVDAFRFQCEKIGIPMNEVDKLSIRLCYNVFWEKPVVDPNELPELPKEISSEGRSLSCRSKQKASSPRERVVPRGVLDDNSAYKKKKFNYVDSSDEEKSYSSRRPRVSDDKQSLNREKEAKAQKSPYSKKKFWLSQSTMSMGSNDLGSDEEEKEPTSRKSSPYNKKKGRAHDSDSDSEDWGNKSTPKKKKVSPSSARRANEETYFSPKNKTPKKNENSDSDDLPTKKADYTPTSARCAEKTSGKEDSFTKDDDDSDNNNNNWNSGKFYRSPFSMDRRRSSRGGKCRDWNIGASPVLKNNKRILDSSDEEANNSKKKKGANGNIANGSLGSSGTKKKVFAKASSDWSD